MNRSAHPQTDHHSFSGTRDIFVGIVLLAWGAVRAPLCMLLVAIEPIVRVVLVGTALVATAVAVLFEFSGAAPKFRFLGMLGFALGCMALLATYYYVLRLVTR